MSGPLFQHRTIVRVRYAETDQMGFVYYGHYAQYFEVGRVEAMRALGFPYKELEMQGIHLPVIDLSVKYHRPARYDEELEVITVIPEPPGVKIKFDYAIKDASGNLLAEGKTTLVFVDAASGKPRRVPAELLKSLM